MNPQDNSQPFNSQPPAVPGANPFGPAPNSGSGLSNLPGAPQSLPGTGSFGSGANVNPGGTFPFGPDVGNANSLPGGSAFAPAPAVPAQPAPVASAFPVDSAAAAPIAANDPKQQVIEKLKGSVNVLVTVGTNPTVDQLAAIIGFTLVLNKLKKHGTAVYSGATPPTIDFLQPEKTIEKTTDSLRDFIVALDKSKADKLRYKVEDKFVKIFITPYHTTLSEKDLEFGQGDLNVDVIIALGVAKRDDLDQAIMAHGRILHDASVISINKEPGDNIGTINWHVPQASSYSEVLVEVSEALKNPQTELFDQQISTAFLTGIVAETERFSNEKTTPQTMSMAAILMRAGANQQLIADKLDEPVPMTEGVALPTGADQLVVDATKASSTTEESPDGSMMIAHEDEPEEEHLDIGGIHIDDEGEVKDLADAASAPGPAKPAASTPPTVPAPSVADDPSTDNAATPVDNSQTIDRDDQTLEDIERSVRSPHLPENQQPAAPPVAPAIDASPSSLEAPGTTSTVPPLETNPLDTSAIVGVDPAAESHPTIPVPASPSEPVTATASSAVPPAPADPATSGTAPAGVVPAEEADTLPSPTPVDSSVSLPPTVPHLTEDEARKKVEAAEAATPPPADLNALPVDLDLGHETPVPTSSTAAESVPLNPGGAEVPEPPKPPEPLNPDLTSPTEPPEPPTPPSAAPPSTPPPPTPPAN